MVKESRRVGRLSYINRYWTVFRTCFFTEQLPELLEILCMDFEDGIWDG